ncbi:MAG: hypothetical protein JSV33_12120 [bacterium]|nr:MAG: hypothetical protein JSV33_12120 [bacterium]
MKILGDDNKRLFADQVNDHIEKLNGLLGLASGAAINESVVEKVTLASRLLEGSTRMIGLADWSQTIGAFWKLLDEVTRSLGCWDEQMSQMVSEVLEAEEKILAELMSGDADADLEQEDFKGLQNEIAALRGECEKKSRTAEQTPVKESVSVEPLGEAIQQSDGFSVIDQLIGSLYRVKDHFREYIEDSNRSAATVRELELAFGESEFYIGLLSGILHRLGNNRKPFLSKVASSTALDGVRDFFNLHGRVRGWNAELQAKSDDISLEREAASTLALLLENCIFDVCRMYEKQTEFKLTIGVDITNRGSFLVARISDNGSDFLCDSEIDREDAVAYYPSLLNVRRILEMKGGLLWVEPDHGRDGRFHFTLPHMTTVTGYHIFTASGTGLAVPAHAVDYVIRCGEVEITEDSKGHCMNLSDMRIPVLGMEELAPEEVDTEGERGYVTVIGIAEKRVGIFTEDPGRITDGILDQLTAGTWASLTTHHLHLGEEEYPVLDVRMVFEKIDYLQRLNGATEELGSFAGGAGLEESYQESTVPRV